MPRQTSEYKPRPKYAKILRSLDPQLDRADKAHSAALVLLAAANVGTRVTDLVAETGWPRSVVQPIAKGFRVGGIFRGGKIRHSGWFDKETGGIAFWLDVSVGLGLLQRRL